LPLSSTALVPAILGTRTIRTSEQPTTALYHARAEVTDLRAASMTSTSRFRSKFSRVFGSFSARALRSRSVKRSPRDSRPNDGREPALSAFYDALSEDGPFRRMSDREARRLVMFACCYYGVLAMALLAVLIWH
jgi:hypothetical protein